MNFIKLSLILSFLIYTNGNDWGPEDQERLNDFIAPDDEKFHKAVQRMPKNVLNDAENFIGERLSTGPCENDEYYKKRVLPVVLRFTRMFLRYTKLGDVELSGNPEHFVYSKLNIAISTKNLAKLQKFSQDERSISLYEVNECLSDIFYYSKVDRFRDGISGIRYCIQWILDFFQWCFDNSQITFFQGAYMIWALYTCLGVYRYGLRRDHVAISLFALTCIDALKEYFIQLKNEEIKYFMRLKERADLETDCNPSNYGVWRIFKNYFYEDPCQKWYRDDFVHHSSHVSLAQCMINTHLGMFFELPMTAVGRVVASMGLAISGSGPYSWLVYPFICAVILFLFVLMGLVYFGNTLSLSALPFGVGRITLERGNSSQAIRSNSTIPESPPSVANTIYHIYNYGPTRRKSCPPEEQTTKRAIRSSEVGVEIATKTVKSTLQKIPDDSSKEERKREEVDSSEESSEFASLGEDDSSDNGVTLEVDATVLVAEVKENVVEEQRREERNYGALGLD